VGESFRTQGRVDGFYVDWLCPTRKSSMKSQRIAPKNPCHATPCLALPLLALAGLLPGCATQHPTPETAQAVIRSLEKPAFAKSPSCNKPWRLGVSWLPGGLGGAAILSPGYGHVVRKNAPSPVQNEPSPNGEVSDLPPRDYPSPHGADGENRREGKSHCPRPCRHDKPKARAGKAIRPRRPASYRLENPCHASEQGK
jgi:hypothetical protein